MNSIESTTAKNDTAANPPSNGRETLNIGIVLPTQERHPVGWLTTRALGTEIEWRNAPVELQWFVPRTATSQWTDDASLNISRLPENLEELEDDVDVLVGFELAETTSEFVVDPTSVDLTLHDATGLLRRYLLPDLSDSTHPAPTLKESIVVDIDDDMSDMVAAEVARHARSRELPVTLIGPSDHQTRFATKLKHYKQTSTALNNDLDPEEFGAVAQHAALIVTSDPALHQMAKTFHGRSVLVDDNLDNKELQRALWSAASNIAVLEPDGALEERVTRLAEVVEQTALLRLNRTISARSASQERERGEQSQKLHEQQSTHWRQQRRQAHQLIDALRQELLQLQKELDIARDDADNTRQALRAQHNRLNELETEIARQDQGPARLQRSVDWHSVAAQLERDVLKVLRWLRNQLGRG
ncbi:MAG: hypothetical protein QF637_10210 [Acidimicrobiales bacterium]|nr:hypothetical protein [Acidimicrobiales bacterium]